MKNEKLEKIDIPERVLNMRVFLCKKQNQKRYKYPI